MSVSDPIQILNQCSNHFFPKESEYLPIHKDLEQEMEHFDHDPCVFEGPPVTDWELQSAVNSLNLESVPGCDDLSPALIEACFPAIRAHLLLLLCACFKICAFPLSWKTSKVVIICKQSKPTYNTLSSFRPISLLNTFAKIQERIILNRLLSFSKIQNWISQSQHGFVEGR